VQSRAKTAFSSNALMGLLVPRGGLLARNVPGNVRWTGHGLGHTRRPIMDLNREEASQMFGPPDTHDRPGWARTSRRRIDVHPQRVVHDREVRVLDVDPARRVRREPDALHDDRP